jgi:hypothetical protein
MSGIKPLFRCLGVLDTNRSGRFIATGLFLSALHVVPEVARLFTPILGLTGRHSHSEFAYAR